MEAAKEGTLFTVLKAKMLQRRSVLFVIAEDWFFASHFLALASRVRLQGYDVSVLLRVTDPVFQKRIEDCGIRVLQTATFRERTGLVGLIRHIRRIRQVLARERPDVVHLISLRMIVVGGLAAIWARVPIRVQALTGLGLLGTAKSLRSRVALMMVGWLLRHVLAGRRSAFIFENREDPERLGIDLRSSRAIVVGGAGIDPDDEKVLPLPAGPPLKVAVVSRMIFSKGIAVAAEAVGLARAAGVEVTLTLVGNPDLGNPRSLTVGDLQALAQQSGIRWVGRSNDIQAVWRDHHVVCVPSLGGEGLPRALLEGAAAGRPVVTTSTPGCVTFVRDQREGFVVPPGDAGALAEAFGALAADPDLVARMGAAARSRVLDGFTIEQVADAVTRLYSQCLQGERAGRQCGSASARQKA